MYYQRGCRRGCSARHPTQARLHPEGLQTARWDGEIHAAEENIPASNAGVINEGRRNNMKRIMLISISTLALCSCNVTRVITNESQYLQKGDTSIVIQTKTIESYDASKKL